MLEAYKTQGKVLFSCRHYRANCLSSIHLSHATVMSMSHIHSLNKGFNTPLRGDHKAEITRLQKPDLVEVTGLQNQYGKSRF